MPFRFLNLILTVAMLFSSVFSIDIDGQHDCAGIEESVVYNSVTPSTDYLQSDNNKAANGRTLHVRASRSSERTTVFACDVLTITVSPYVFSPIPPSVLPTQWFTPSAPTPLQDDLQSTETRGPPRAPVFQLSAGLRAPPSCLTVPFFAT